MQKLSLVEFFAYFPQLNLLDAKVDRNQPIWFAAQIKWPVSIWRQPWGLISEESVSF